MKLATTIGEMYAFTRTPAEAVRQYAGSGFRCLDYSFYNVAKHPDDPFLGENWRDQILEAREAAKELGFTFESDAFFKYGKRAGNGGPLAHPTLEIKRASLALLHTIGKSMLQTYGVYED